MKQKIRSWVLRLQRLLADRLQAKSEKLSPRHKKLLLVLFCLSFAAMSVCSVVTAFTGKQKNMTVKTNIPRIRHEQEKPAPPFISRQEFERIEKFKQQVYALPRPALDSFMRARPKLLDSIRTIEKYYRDGTMGQ